MQVSIWRSGWWVSFEVLNMRAVSRTGEPDAERSGFVPRSSPYIENTAITASRQRLHEAYRHRSPPSQKRRLAQQVTLFPRRSQLD